MVSRATIDKRKNDNYKMAPGLAKHFREMSVKDAEDGSGLLECVWADPQEPAPEGTEACFGKCQRYTTHTYYWCWAANCIEVYCDECRRCSWGNGPVGCPCDEGKGSGGFGHRTRGEQPKKAHRKLVKRRGRR